MGASFTLEVTPSDELIPYIGELKELTLAKVGALPHITVARNESKSDYPLLTSLSRDEYKKVWGQFDSKLFEFKMSIFGKKRKEYCFAGNWSFTLNLITGVMKQCYCTNFFANIFKNPDKKLNFVNIGRACKAPHCHNGHAFLTIGSIPELETPYFVELRNRVCLDGSEWLNPECKALFSSKMMESNEQIKPFKDVITNHIYSAFYKLAWNGRKIMKKLKPDFKSYEQRKR